MRDAVICEPLRTPVGRFGGVFRDLPAAKLASTVVSAVVERTGLPHEAIDDVLLGQYRMPRSWAEASERHQLLYTDRPTRLSY